MDWILSFIYLAAPLFTYEEIGEHLGKTRSQIKRIVRNKLGLHKDGTKYYCMTHEYWSYVKGQAKQRDIEFSLRKEDICNQLVSRGYRCNLSGRKISELLMPGDPDAGSLDRIDSSKGYLSGNIQMVTKQINISKHSMSNEEFINLCRDVVRWHDRHELLENFREEI